jgi:tetratricopeptide (TPR) repeat protein
MIFAPRANRVVYRTALTASLSAGVLALVGCVSQPANTNARNTDPNLQGQSVAQNDWEKKEKDPAITPETFYAAGQLAESQEMTDKAIGQYNKALKLNKDHLPSLFRLGVIYAKNKQFPQAIVVWKHYLEATGGDATAYANVGFCYELSGNFEAAEDAYESGIRRDPSSAACRVNYGLMLARRGRFNQAMHEWQVVLPPAEVYYNMGSAYEAMDRKEQAKAEFHKALEADPQLADARARLEQLGDKVPAFAATPPVAQAPGPQAPVASTPETAPSEAPVAAAPSTAPSGAPMASTPTTAPSEAAAAPDPEAAPVEQAAVPTTAPSTQPVAAGPAPTTSPAGDHPEANVSDPASDPQPN